MGDVTRWGRNILHLYPVERSEPCPARGLNNVSNDETQNITFTEGQPQALRLSGLATCRATADQPDFTEALEVSVARNTRLANFIGGFARLVRLPPPAPQPTDVGGLLRATARLLQPQSAERRIQWQLSLPEEPLIVSLDAQQLEQALLNVAKNALEAIDHDGNIWVRATASPPALAIENDGPSLTPEVRERLFTPFFSTKRDGQGIGLTLVRDVLLAHGFRFRLETNAAGHTAFIIEFQK